MIARTAAEAVGMYLRSFQQALACVTRTVPGISARGRDPSLPTHRLALNAGVPVPLQGPGRISLTIVEDYRIDHPYACAYQPRRADWEAVLRETSALRE